MDSKTIVSKVLSFKGPDFNDLNTSVIYYTSGAYELFFNDEMKAYIPTIEQVKEYLVEELDLGFFAAFISNNEVADYLFEHDVTQMHSVLRSDGGAMVFLSNLFSPDNIGLILEELSDKREFMEPTENVDFLQDEEPEEVNPEKKFIAIYAGIYN